MTRYIEGYDGIKFMDSEARKNKATGLRRFDDGKVYLIDKKGNKIGEGVTVEATGGSSGDFLFYDSDTGEFTTETGTLDGFDYVEI